MDPSGEGRTLFEHLLQTGIAWAIECLHTTSVNSLMAMRDQGVLAALGLSAHTDTRARHAKARNHPSPDFDEIIRRFQSAFGGLSLDEPA